MKQHPRRRSKRRTPAPTLHDLLRQPDADFYRLPDLEIRSGRIVTDGCRRVLDFAHRRSRWMWAARLLHFMALRCE